MGSKNRHNFTKKAIEEFLPPTEKLQEHWWDTKIRGLYVLITSHGTKTFYVRRKVKGRSERILLG